MVWRTTKSAPTTPLAWNRSRNIAWSFPRRWCLRERSSTPSAAASHASEIRNGPGTATSIGASIPGSPSAGESTIRRFQRKIIIRNSARRPGSRISWSETSSSLPPPIPGTSSRPDGPPRSASVSDIRGTDGIRTTIKPGCTTMPSRRSAYPCGPGPSD